MHDERTSPRASARTHNAGRPDREEDRCARRRADTGAGQHGRAAARACAVAQPTGSLAVSTP